MSTHAPRPKGKSVQRLTRVLGTAMLAAVMIGQPLGALPAFAQSTSAPVATAGTISGRITDADGSPISGASINVTGPTRATTTTDRDGRYSVSVPPGIYRILVRAGGFSEVSEDNIQCEPRASDALQPANDRPDPRQRRNRPRVQRNGRVAIDDHRANV
jgi:Carboxypeptidase regulatory-like domain